MRRIFCCTLLLSLVWPLTCLAAAQAPLGDFSSIVATGHIALHVREDLTTKPQVKILDPVKAGSIQQHISNQQLQLSSQQANTVNIAVILPELDNIQLKQGASLMLFKRRHSRLQMSLQQAGNIRIDGTVDLQQIQGSGTGSIYIPSINAQQLAVILDWQGDVTLAGDKLGLNYYRRRGDGNTTITGINTNALQIHQFGSGQIRFDGTKLNVSHIERRGEGDLSVGHLGTTPLTANINNGNNTLLTGKAINLQRLQYQGAGNITVDHLNSDNLHLTTNAASTSEIKLIGKVNLRELHHLGQSHLTFTHVVSSHLDLHALGAGDIEIHGAVRPHDINLGGDVMLKLDNIDTNLLDIQQSGHSKVLLRGKAKVVNAHLTDHSLLSTYYFPVATMHIRTDDQANAHIMVTTNLYANARGHSNIYYYRQPTFLSPMLQDAGSILPLFNQAPPYPLWWSHANEYQVDKDSKTQYNEDRISTDSLLPPAG